MLRAAKIGDLNFVFELIIEGAEKGHFSRELCESPNEAHAFRLELASILENGVNQEGMQSYGLVYESEGKRIGFMFMKAAFANRGNELWLAAIHPDYRNKGFGKAMILTVLNKFQGKNLYLYARCSPESKVMYQLLIKNGFQLNKIGSDGTRALIYQL